MSVVAEVEETGSIPVLNASDLRRRGPFVRDKEDVPHEGAIPDLYGVVADEVLAQAIEDGRLRWWVNLRTGETVLSARTSIRTPE